MRRKNSADSGKPMWIEDVCALVKLWLSWGRRGHKHPPSTFLTGILCFLVVSFAAARQTNQLKQGEFRDRAQNLYARNLDSMSFTTISPELRKFTFKSQSGKKVIATFKKQRLTLEATMVVGTISVKGRAFELRDADLTGGVKTIVERPSGAPDAKTPQTTTIIAPAARYDAIASTVTSLGDINFTSADPALSRSLKASGSKGTITLSKDPAAKDGVSKAVIDGPVNIELRGVRDEKDEKTDKVSRIPYFVTGKGAKLVYDAILRTVTLTGDVRLDGDDPVFGGEIRASKAVLTLDAKGELVSVDFEGPGETTLKEKKGGGG